MLALVSGSGEVGLAALIKAGLNPMGVHLFLMYWGMISFITPPVAMAVYAANTLSQAKIVEASIAAVKLGMTGFIVPFMFVYEPSILLQGDIFGIITVVGFATLG